MTYFPLETFKDKTISYSKLDKQWQEKKKKINIAESFRRFNFVIGFIHIKLLKSFSHFVIFFLYSSNEASQMQTWSIISHPRTKALRESKIIQGSTLFNLLVNIFAYLNLKHYIRKLVWTQPYSLGYKL